MYSVIAQTKDSTIIIPNACLIVNITHSADSRIIITGITKIDKVPLVPISIKKTLTFEAENFEEDYLIIDGEKYVLDSVIYGSKNIFTYIFIDYQTIRAVRFYNSHVEEKITYKANSIDPVTHIPSDYSSKCMEFIISDNSPQFLKWFYKPNNLLSDQSPQEAIDNGYLNKVKEVWENYKASDYR